MKTLSICLLAAGCVSSATDTVAIVPGPDEVVVNGSLSFTPANLTVPAGTTVHFRNAGPFNHTVTSGAGSKTADRAGLEFDAAFPPNGTFDFTFDEIGEHPYFCRPHESMGMKGVITVVAAPVADAGTGGD